MKVIFSALLFTLSFLQGAALFAQTPYEQACAALAASRQPDAGRLHELFKLVWDYTMIESPEAATYYGHAGQNHRWEDLSPAAVGRRKRELSAPMKVLLSVDRARLTPDDQLNYDLFKWNLDEQIEGAKFPLEYLQLTQLNGVQQGIAQTVVMMPAAKLADYENIVSRLHAAPYLIEETTALLKKGLAAGVTPPRVTLRDVPDQVLNQIPADVRNSPMMRPFQQFPPGISEGDQQRLRQAAETALTTRIFPAFRELHAFLTNDYLPGARESIACRDLPNGAEWYAWRARRSTTTTLTPPQIHELGLSEVKRIRAEMERVMRSTGFKGSLPEFFEFMRTDKQFYYERGTELLAGYRDISKRVDGELTKLFGKLPRLPYGVTPIPSYAEKSQTTAYYMPGTLAAGRPGQFFANTYALNTRPKWEMEALTLHEAVPGHHLQISIAQELENVPEFRRHGEVTAFVEGWGLYSESLGVEMGFYQDPYSKFGQLTYEMWRAIRLVVDTGMHSLGWSRQQAIDFFKANAGKTGHDIVVEVDRYIVWPGQALAYKIGELKIKELRANAAKELGEKFDVRKFHDELLGAGAMPLEILETRMKAWGARQKG